MTWPTFGHFCFATIGVAFACVTWYCAFDIMRVVSTWSLFVFDLFDLKFLCKEASKQAIRCFRWFQSFLIEPKPIGPLSLHRRLKKCLCINPVHLTTARIRVHCTGHNRELDFSACCLCQRWCSSDSISLHACRCTPAGFCRQGLPLQSEKSGLQFLTHSGEKCSLSLCFWVSCISVSNPDWCFHCRPWPMWKCDKLAMQLWFQTLVLTLEGILDLHFIFVRNKKQHVDCHFAASILQGNTALRSSYYCQLLSWFRVLVRPDGDLPSLAPKCNAFVEVLFADALPAGVSISIDTPWRARCLFWIECCTHQGGRFFWVRASLLCQIFLQVGRSPSK